MQRQPLHRSNAAGPIGRRFMPGFDPGTTPGLTGWWKADRRDLLDQSGGVRALAADDPVGIWSSPSLSLPTLTTGAGNRPPLKLNAAPNGKRMVYNDGAAGATTDQFTLGADTDYYSASARCGFLVVRSDTPANNAFLLRTGGATVRAAIQWLTSGPTVRYTITDSGGAKNVDVAVPAGTMLVLSWRHAGGKLYGSINGGTETQVTCGNQATTGEQLNWPSRASTDVKFKGWFGEFLLLSADPGVSWRNRIGRYLAGQWAGTWAKQS